jgi:signal transduction histidine kinase
MVLSDNLEIIESNYGMKELLQGNSLRDILINPTWDKIAQLCNSTSSNDIFTGHATIKTNRYAIDSTSMQCKVTRYNGMIICMLEYEIDELLDSTKNVFDLNREISRLQRDLILKNNELESKNRELARTIETQNKLLGMAAHDLRNPIGAIHSFVDLMLEDEDEYSLVEDTKEILDIISQSSAYMMYIISNLLDLSKINAGKLDLKQVNTTFLELLNNVLNRTKFSAKKKDINIIVEKSEQLNDSIYVDKLYIEQVIENILSNSIKYTFRGTDVIINIFNEEDKLTIEFIDNGVGIKETEQNKLFKAFSKTSSVPTEDESSTGLGLAISKKVIEASGGTIGYRPNSPSGSIFWFSLKLTSN